MERLVEQAKVGDRLSLNALYDRYRQRAFATCLHITRDKELSEELVDDAFLIAFSKLDHLNDPEKFGQWLSAISTRLALRQLKRQPEKRTIPISHIEGFDVPCEAHDVPFTSEELQSAIDQLPTGYRQVFTMAVIEGKPHKEIAQALNIEPHSSSSQLYHARVMLRRILGPLLCVLLLAMPFFLTQDPSVGHSQSTAQASEVSATGKTVSVADSIPVHPVKTIQDKLVEIESHDTAMPVSPTSPLDVMPFKTLTPDRENDCAQLNLLTAHSTGRWSVMVAMTHSLSGNGLAQRPHALWLPSVSATSGMGQGVEIANWRDCKQYVIENSTLFSDEVAAALIRIAQSNEIGNDGEIIRAEQHEPPISVSMTIHYSIDSVLGIYTGVGLGEYRSYFQTGVGRDRIDEQQSVTFLGIPVGVSYGLNLTPRTGCYLSADFSVQLPLSFHSSTSFVLDGQENGTSAEIPIFEQSSHIMMPNFTTGLKVGVQYRLAEHVGVFAEGGCNYTFSGGRAVVTYVTVHPFVISTQAGLLFIF